MLFAVTLGQYLGNIPCATEIKLLILFGNPEILTDLEGEKIVHEDKKKKTTQIFI